MGHAPERAYDHVIQVNICPILTAVCLLQVFLKLPWLLS